MNASDRSFVTRIRYGRLAQILGGVVATGLLAGCVTEPVASTRVDPSSPVAADVAKLATANRAFPTFSQIPPAPKDLRPVAQYGRQAQQIVSARDQLDAATTNTWTLGGTAAFASRAQSDAGPDFGTASTTSDTEAFAAALRKRATPPPPPTR